MMKRFLALTAAVLCAVLLLTSCQGNQPEPTSSTEPISSSEPEPVIPDEGNLNPLTGRHDLSGDAVGKRPVTVMVSNIKAALPQYGIGQADVVYETLVEGGITRLMAVFADPNHVPTVGPVRSVREYYPDIAAPLDPLFIHYGGSPTGYGHVKDNGLISIDGITQPGSFYLDEQLRQAKGKEHSNFTSTDLFADGVNRLGYSMEGKELAPLFHFVEGTVPSEGAANSVQVSFSGYDTASFDYDAAAEKYLKGEFGQAQMDAGTGQQIAVDNVFVLYASIYPHPDGSERVAMNLTSGDGVYICGGHYQTMSWSKGSVGEQFQFTDASGNTLAVRPGSSWVCIVPIGRDAVIE